MSRREAQRADAGGRAEGGGVLARGEEQLDLRLACTREQLAQRRQVALAQRIHAHSHLALGARQRHGQILAAGGRSGGGGAVEDVLHGRAHAGRERLHRRPAGHRRRAG